MTLDDLARLFESAAMGEAYGEDISIRDHMLQCAELAVAQHLGDVLVAAALFHDIGWGAGAGADGHERTGADLVAPVLGAAVADAIRLHVPAKRWLVATDPGYAALLSACSRQTLVAQGGPFSPDECAAFARETGFADALALRRLDDAGKAEDGARSTLADYLPLLRRLTAPAVGGAGFTRRA